jgi:hypothetical protein
MTIRVRVRAVIPARRLHGEGFGGADIPAPPGRSASADNRPKINFFIIYRFASSVLTCKYTGLLRTVQEIRRKYFGERKKGHSPRPGNIRPANRPPTDPTTDH